MLTASMPDFTIISSTSVYAATPYLAANADTLSRFLLQTAVKLEPVRRLRAFACRWATFPHPTIPVLILFNLISLRAVFSPDGIAIVCFRIGMETHL